MDNELLIGAAISFVLTGRIHFARDQPLRSWLISGCPVGTSDGVGPANLFFRSAETITG